MGSTMMTLNPHVESFLSINDNERLHNRSKGDITNVFGDNIFNIPEQEELNNFSMNEFAYLN